MRVPQSVWWKDNKRFLRKASWVLFGSRQTPHKPSNFFFPLCRLLVLIQKHLLAVPGLQEGRPPRAARPAGTPAPVKRQPVAGRERRAPVVAHAAARGRPVQRPHHDHVLAPLEPAALRLVAVVVHPGRVMVVVLRRPQGAVGLLAPRPAAPPAVLALVVDLRKVLRHFDLDLVRDHDAVDVAAHVRPEDGQRGHDGCDVDLEDGQHDRRRAVPGRVEGREGRRLGVDDGFEADDGADD